MNRTAGSAARIVDANLNRAREGLRVAEEYARFALSDRGQAAALRALRRDLGAAAAELFKWNELTAARESSGDIGAAAPTSARPDEAAVARAALSRASEALRSVEEYGSLLAPAAAERFARLRFRLYNVEREVAAGPSARKRRLEGARLYVLLTAEFCRNGDVFETARRAAAGGADLFQYREKEMEDGEFLANARKLAALCADLGVLLIINDRPHVARLAGADGVHLGQGDLSAADAREILGPGRIVGRSTHEPAQARAAEAEGADYIGVGPVFETRTKEHRTAVGLEYVAFCQKEIAIPGFAIGSVNEQTVDQVLAAGARRIAVCTGVTMQDDVEAAARFFKQKLEVAEKA
ncbi:MAG TPA: thiamine phosphate synthase [Planctomycetota bacterium]|nr:thiamine phosphate synthase [Planctomycetota bacterium]